MVETKSIIETILKRLEKYLIRKCNFALSGDNYDLILFIPSDNFFPDSKYSLLISAKWLNNQNQKQVIRELLFDFKEALGQEEYNAISRLNILHTEDSFVRNIKSVFKSRALIEEIKHFWVGEINLEYAFLIKSLILDKLIIGKALTMEVNINHLPQVINAGIIRIEQNYDVVYYTGKGLKEIFSQNISNEENNNAAELKKMPESFLIENNYINKINLDDVIKVF